MSTSVLDALLASVDVEANIIPFLKYSGWTQAEAGSPRWLVMHGERSADDQPFELVFPTKTKEAETRPYVIKAIELLTALRNEPMQLVVQSVIKYDRDIMYVRNMDTDHKNAIALNLAANQIANLRKSIEYSVCSEREAKPYFNEPTPMARRVVRDFLFGHTIAGSFGFTVEAPQLPDPPQFIQTRLPLAKDEPPPSTDVPFERRVVERIARGLLFTSKAQHDRDHRILVSEYASGFNSNMCAAIADMASSRPSEIEFRVSWSPKVRAGDDVAKAQPTRIREPGYVMLKDVAKRLRNTKPDYVEIVGYVRALTSSDNPQSLGTRRAVVVRSLIPGASRVTDVVVELDRDDYAKADDAHMNWRNAAVDGILSRSGVGWRLLNPRNFRIIK